MLNDAQIREYEIQIQRGRRDKYEKELTDGIENPLEMMTVLSLYNEAQRNLDKLEVEAADDLELAKELGGK